jgi:acyl-coenzyme A thioesterase PaaI-like protein
VVIPCSELDRADNLLPFILESLKDRLGDRMGEYAFPPPIFAAMKGEIVELDLDAGSLAALFPVLDSYLNPFGAVQGGMVAAAVDNAIGPLSMLVAPPNVTRQLGLTYSQPVTLDMGYIVVRARLRERRGRRLFFRATVHSRQGPRLARAEAVHWITGETEV